MANLSILDSEIKKRKLHSKVRSITFPSVQPLLRWLSSPAGALLSGILTVSSCSLLTKGMGFGKDLVVASRFGTGDALDAFAMAYLLPALVSSVFGGVQDALIPAHAEQIETGSKESAAELAASGFSLYALLTGLVFLLMGCFARNIVGALAANFGPAKQELTRQLFVQLLPFAWCLGLTHYLTGWLNSNKRFIISSMAPVVIPLCSAIVLLLWPGPNDLSKLVLGTQIGGGAYLLLLAYGLVNREKVRLFATGWQTPQLKRMAADTWPLFAGTIITCGLPFVDTIMAGHLKPGDVSVLSYSEKICSIFFAVLATSVGTALFPFLADLSAQGKWQALKTKLHQYAFFITLASLPIVVLIYFLAPWIVGILFQRGAFVADDVDRVSLVLRCHAVQIPFYIVAVLTSHVVMALRAGKYMLFTTVVNLSLNVVLNLVFISWIGLPGIPLATALVYVISGLMLYAYVHREVGRRTKLSSNHPTSPQPCN